MAGYWLCPDDWNEVRRGPFIAHVFFEFETLVADEVRFLRAADLVTSGSRWAEGVLEAHGLPAATVHQGVDLSVFRPSGPKERRPPELADRFVVFAGGKYEYRKGWDLVIAAFARFLERRADAFLLVNAWNPWPATQAGLQYSPHFSFLPVESYPADMARALVHNGVPEGNFRVLSPAPRAELAAAIRQADCGLFPIRAEGGTNHFLMEAMACGIPVVATRTTGLIDLLEPDENAVALCDLRSVTANVVGPEPDRGTWQEPTVDEIVVALERLYGSPDERERLARAALATIADFAWPRCADRLVDLLP